MKTTIFDGQTTLVSMTIAPTTTTSIPRVDDHNELGFTWFTVEVVAVVLLILLHASMVLFIVVQGRHEKTFRQAFYTFFVLVTVVDCFHMLIVRAVRFRTHYRLTSFSGEMTRFVIFAQPN